MKEDRIAILMATYNGARFLNAQIDSIISQTYKEWHLYVHDDGSTDETTGILTTYASQHPEQITILEYPSQGGACRNFMSMLQRVEAPYYMFADQDDVWHKEKISRSMQAMHEEEERHPGLPIVVHSDLRIVNDDLQLLHRSFFEYSNLHPERISHYEQYVQNIVTGSTMLFNQPARTAALDRPARHATMHDAWITLRTVAEGGIRHTIYDQLTDYRQHAENVLGAQDGNRFTILYRITHVREMLLLNLQHLRMLRSAGKMGVLTFIKQKHLAFKQNNKI